jgi:probable rRNA maturation factor
MTLSLDFSESIAFEAMDSEVVASRIDHRVGWCLPMIFISNTCRNIDFDETVIYHAALVTLRAHDLEDCEVSILLTDDAEIQNLNRQYRNINTSTDVLAFAMREGPNGNMNPQLLGDLVLSAPTAQRQSVVHGHALEVELALLTVHGILHLLGYNHQTPEEAEIMIEKQEAMLRLI